MDRATHFTQGGGTARQIGREFVFVDPPPLLFNLHEGDAVPEGWGIQPINPKVEATIEEWEDMFWYGG